MRPNFETQSWELEPVEQRAVPAPGDLLAFANSEDFLHLIVDRIADIDEGKSVYMFHSSADAMTARQRAEHTRRVLLLASEQLVEYISNIKTVDLDYDKFIREASE